MNRFGIVATAVGTAMLAACASAQAEPPAQTQNQMMGRGPGMGMGMGMGMGWGPENTSGWSMMTSAERQEHMTRMQSFTNREQCEAYMTEHHRLMVERARERGMDMPAEPRMNPCLRLK